MRNYTLNVFLFISFFVCHCGNFEQLLFYYYFSQANGKVVATPLHLHVGRVQGSFYHGKVFRILSTTTNHAKDYKDEDACEDSRRFHFFNLTDILSLHYIHNDVCTRTFLYNIISRNEWFHGDMTRKSIFYGSMHILLLY